MPSVHRRQNESTNSIWWRGYKECQRASLLWIVTMLHRCPCREGIHGIIALIVPVHLSDQSDRFVWQDPTKSALLLRSSLVQVCLNIKTMFSGRQISNFKFLTSDKKRLVQEVGKERNCKCTCDIRFKKSKLRSSSKRFCLVADRRNESSNASKRCDELALEMKRQHQCLCDTQQKLRHCSRFACDQLYTQV